MLITLHDHDPRPLYQQVAAGVKEEVQAGRLKPGDPLPSVRELADALGINLHTVHKAYQVLRDQGVITLRLGRAARIAPLRTTPVDREEIERRLGRQVRDLVGDAFHLGLTPEALRKLLDDEIQSRTWHRNEP
jgi:GntR family transcriptional regulator